jgi:hypothetical protein
MSSRAKWVTNIVMQALRAGGLSLNESQACDIDTMFHKDDPKYREQLVKVSELVTAAIAECDEQQGSTRTPTVVHYCNYASQSDIRICCTQRLTLPLWNTKETGPVWSASHGMLYTFEKAFVTCRLCQVTLRRKEE